MLTKMKRKIVKVKTLSNYDYLLSTKFKIAV